MKCYFYVLSVICAICPLTYSTYMDKGTTKAAQEGNIEKVQHTLASGIDCNLKDFYASTLLHHAADHGRTQMIAFLLDNGANINAEDYNGNTALHRAAECGQVEAASLLLDRGADVAAQNTYKSTPLHAAASKGHIEVAKILLHAGADSNALANTDVPPLQCALFQRRDALAEYLLDQGAVLTQFLINEYATKLLLDKAVVNKNLKLVANLLNQGVCSSPSAEKFISEKRQELFQAILQDDLDTVRTLIKQGLSINTCDKQRNTLLHKAVVSGNTRIFKYLLALLHKVDTDKMHTYVLRKNSIGKTPLNLATESNQAIFKLLLDQEQETQELDLAKVS